MPHPCVFLWMCRSAGASPGRRRATRLSSSVPAWKIVLILGATWKGGAQLCSARKAVIVLVPTGRVGTLYPSSAPAGEPTLSGAPFSPCFAAESTREGTLMSLPEGIATPRSR